MSLVNFQGCGNGRISQKFVRDSEKSFRKESRDWWKAGSLQRGILNPVYFSVVRILPLDISHSIFAWIQGSATDLNTSKIHFTVENACVNNKWQLGWNTKNNFDNNVEMQIFSTTFFLLFLIKLFFKEGSILGCLTYQMWTT